MRRIGMVSLCTVALVIFLFMVVAPGYAENELCIPMGVLTLHAPSGVTPKRASVKFPHSAHFGIPCQTCHHTWNGKTQIKSCTAVGCHDQLGTPRNPKTGMPDTTKEIKYYKKAFHQCCIDCHKKIKEKNMALELSDKVLKTSLQKTGPTGCVECHPKTE